MSEQAEGERLLDDTTGRYLWLCAQNCTQEQARAWFIEREKREPQYVLWRDRLWWCGPARDYGEAQHAATA